MLGVCAVGGWVAWVAVVWCDVIVYEWVVGGDVVLGAVGVVAGVVTENETGITYLLRL